MTEAETILQILSDYLKANPSIRFCQALSNLNILQKFPVHSGTKDIEDPYYNTDKDVLERIKT